MRTISREEAATAARVWGRPFWDAWHLTTARRLRDAALEAARQAALLLEAVKHFILDVWGLGVGRKAPALMLQM